MEGVKDREHLPLLADDAFSDEEVRPYSEGRRTWRKYNIASIRGRATSKMKGASAVMNQWPNHVSTSVFKFWVVVLLLVIVLLVVYSFIMTHNIIPNNRYGRGIYKVPQKITSLESLIALPQVFCPVIVNPNEQFDLNLYVEPIEKLKDKFPNYDYNIIIIINDTDKNMVKDNNILAMDKVLNHEKLSNEIEKSREYLSFNVQKHLLSDFIIRTPLKGKFKTISNSVMPFLVRAISIWDDGGISFDPNVILGGATDFDRLKNHIDDVLRTYSDNNDVTKYYHLVGNHDSNINHSAPNTHIDNTYEYLKTLENRSVVNNIQDVINVLENNEKSSARSETDLDVEEARLGPFFRKILSIDPNMEYNMTERKSIIEIGPEINKTFVDVIIKEKSWKDEISNTNLNVDLHNNSENKNNSIDTVTSENKDYFQQNTTKNFNLTRGAIQKSVHTNIDFVPYLFEMLFNSGSLETKRDKLNNPNYGLDSVDNVPKSETDIIHMSKRSTTPMKRFEHLDNSNLDIFSFRNGGYNSERITPKNKGNIVFEDNALNDKGYKDITTIKQESIAEEIKRTHKVDDDLLLTLDLKGKFIATKASCPAFVGELFKTVLKHPNIRSIEELIDTSLKEFCYNKTNSACFGLKLIP